MEKSDQKPIAFVVVGGSFCPVHQGHVTMLETGARMAEERGYRVVAKYLAAAPQ